MATYGSLQKFIPGTKRILVIGAKGMLGKDLVKVLHSRLNTKQRSDWEILEWDIDELDIRDGKRTVTLIESYYPETIINVAGYTNVDGCESNEEKAFAINAEGMKHVALGAHRCRAKVVYLSTDYIFDGKKKEPYLEDDPPNPLNVYGRSKWKGEQYVRELVENGLIVRTQWLYGKYGNNFVTSILNQAREKKALSIVNDQIGSPTYTVDLSEAIFVLLQGDTRGVFHVANRDTCSWYTYGQTILKLSGMDRVKVVPISSKEFGRSAIRPPYSVLSCQKLKKVTGMTMRPWSEALKDFITQTR
jgi:dTDP-4-dehydrorhamnose reductase